METLGLPNTDSMRFSGYPRDAAYSESLRRILRKAPKIERIEDGDDVVRVGRIATYVVVPGLVGFRYR